MADETNEQTGAGVELPSGELPALGPLNPDSKQAEVEQQEQLSPGSSPEELQKAGASPADLEIKMAPGGEPIIVRQNPESPTPHLVAGSISEVPGPANVVVTVSDRDGNDREVALDVGDRVQAGQRAQAAISDHPANAAPGYSNPALTETTDEEKEADAKAYADRFGGDSDAAVQRTQQASAQRERDLDRQSKAPAPTP